MAGGLMAAGSASASEDADLADRLQQIEDQLWVLGAKEAIRTKLYLYCRGDDRQDPDTGKQAFAEDSHVDYGTHPVIGKVFEGPGRDWVEHLRRRDRPRHHRSGRLLHALLLQHA